MENNIEHKVLLAKTNNKELDNLIIEQLPFIKDQLIEINMQNMLTVAKLAFINSVKKYNENNGSFLEFASVHIKRISINFATENCMNLAKSAINECEINDGSLSLKDEIKSISLELEKYDLGFSDIVSSCPKKIETRRVLINLGNEIIMDEHFRRDFRINYNVPIADLSDKCLISKDILYKYKNYLIICTILILGDYPNLRVFFPHYMEA